MTTQENWLLFHQKNKGKKIMNVQTNKQIYLWEIFWSGYKIINNQVYKGIQIIENFKII